MNIVVNGRVSTGYGNRGVVMLVTEERVLVRWLVKGVEDCTGSYTRENFERLVLQGRLQLREPETETAT